MTEGAVETEVGRARLRKEDARLLTGQTHWTDNIQAAGMLHLAILRSPMAHARLERVDVSPALELPGVVAAFTGSDLAEGMGSLPCAWPVTEDMVHPDHPPLAVDEVRHAGDPVAVVVARDRYAAADALEAVEVEYEPLPRCSTWRRRSPRTRRWSTPTRARTAVTTGRSGPVRTTRRSVNAPRWSSNAATTSSGSSPTRWSRVRSWSRRSPRPASTRCTRPRRSRTSCA